jgi:GNAT superfamily N-acetyltransferase
MMSALADVDVQVVSPDSAEGRLVLTSYFRDVLGRYHGRPPTQAEVDTAINAEPRDNLCPPNGLFFIARDHGAVVGCAGLRLRAGGAGEVRRKFVMPQARRKGVGQRLLDAVEGAARVQRVRLLRLDTGGHPTEAGQLYLKNGFHEVPPFNDFDMADRWYEKPVT